MLERSEYNSCMLQLNMLWFSKLTVWMTIVFKQFACLLFKFRSLVFGILHSSFLGSISFSTLYLWPSSCIFLIKNHPMFWFWIAFHVRSLFSLLISLQVAQLSSSSWFLAITYECLTIIGQWDSCSVSV